MYNCEVDVDKIKMADFGFTVGEPSSFITRASQQVGYLFSGMDRQIRMAKCIGGRIAA